MNVPPQSSRQNFPESPVSSNPRTAVAPSKTAKQGSVEGELNANEREILTKAIAGAPAAPRTVVEVGTWLGGGSTLHILRALGKNGKVIPDEPSAIAAALIKLAQDRDLNNRMGEAAYETGAKGNTWQDYGDRLLAEYRRRLENRRSTAFRPELIPTN